MYELRVHLAAINRKLRDGCGPDGERAADAHGQAGGEEDGMTTEMAEPLRAAVQRYSMDARRAARQSCAARFTRARGCNSSGTAGTLTWSLEEYLSRLPGRPADDESQRRRLSE